MNALSLILLIALSPQTDSKAFAEEVVAKMTATLSKAKALQGRAEVVSYGETEAFDFKFLKPNFAKFQSKHLGVYQDGKSSYTMMLADKRYSVAPAPAAGLPAGASFNLGAMVGLEALVFPNDTKLTPTSAKEERFAGKDCYAVQLKSEGNAQAKITLYVDRKNWLPAGWNYALLDFSAKGQYKSLVIDPKLTPDQFSWRPPQGATRVGGE